MYKSNKTILILGAYGGLNIGDELILSSLLLDLKKIFHAENITVFSLDADNTKKNHNIYSVYAGKKTLGALITFKQLLFADLLIIGGGGLIQDYGKSPNTIINYLIRALFAKILNKKLVFCAIGVGPIELRLSKFLIPFVMNRAALITTRDQESNNLLRSLGVKKPKIITTTDPVFALKMKSVSLSNSASFRTWQKFSSKKSGPQIAICLLPFFKSAHGNFEKDLEIQRIIASVGVHLIRNYNANIIFLPFERRTDIEESIAVSRLMGQNKNVIVLKKYYSHSDVQDIISQMDLIIGMRLHSLILAALQKVPSVAIVYHPKIQSFLRLTNQEETGLDLFDLQVSKLKDKVEYVMRNNFEIQKKIQHSLTELRAKASMNVELITEII